MSDGACPSCTEVVTPRYTFNAPQWDSSGCFSRFCTFHRLLSATQSMSYTNPNKVRRKPRHKHPLRVIFSQHEQLQQINPRFCFQQNQFGFPDHWLKTVWSGLFCMTSVCICCYWGCLLLLLLRPCDYGCCLAEGCLNINNATMLGLISVERSIDGRSLSAVMQE